MSAGTNSRVGRTIRMVNVQGNTPDVSWKVQPGEDWIPFGRRNLFPEFVVGLLHNFQPALSAVDTMSLYLAGDGVEFLDAAGKPIQEAADAFAELTQLQGQSYFLRSVYKDLVIMGHRTFEVAYDRTQRPAALYHIDATRIRCTPKNAETGIVEGFRFCSNWELQKGNKTDFPIINFDAWNAGITGPKDKQLSFRKLYVPQQDYYGLPWWIGALTDMEVGMGVPRFNRTQLETGFRPAFHIHVFTSKDDFDLRKLDEDIEMVFTGVDGKSYVVTHGPLNEGAPAITKLERGDHAGELDKMGDRAALIAYNAIGVPPILQGADVNAGMGGQGLAIEQTVTMFQRMKCVPYQAMVNEDLKAVITEMGVKGIAKVRSLQLSPFDQATDPVLNRQTYIARTTLNMDLMNNGLEPRKPGDPMGEMLLCDLLRGAGNLDPQAANA